MIHGYNTEQACASAAMRMKIVGLTGSGQQCCPVTVEQVDEYGLLGEEFAWTGWAYWTAHNYFAPRREPGEFYLPGGKILQGEDVFAAIDAAMYGE